MMNTVPHPLRIVFLGLSITSSWGNGHATNYRGLLGQLAARGHDVLFLERDAPWYAGNRDLAKPPSGRTELYQSLDDLRIRFEDEIARADVVVLGSYVREGVAAGEWLSERARGVKVFYDLDTPVTMAKLAAGDHEYLVPHLIRKFDLYLSFTGGPLLDEIERIYGCPRARAFYCMVDPGMYYPEERPARIDLGYLGTYSEDRQPTLDRLLLDVARRRQRGRYLVVGPQYPESIDWPRGVRRLEHLPPAQHRRFYNAQRFTLNVTRRDMIRAGFSPSVRLFEAAACGTPIISDVWAGIETLLEPGQEILLARDTDDVLEYLNDLPGAERERIAERARKRILSEHTAEHRAREFESHIAEVLTAGPVRRQVAGSTRR